ncbi:pyrroloquinoline quinone-dependent dehydrogenase [Pseudoteredinibacter isoporae]|uniref:pyrroloquinoline quinone-dependent dehydrogenase n=1 Tax=Pseudoteredinibacter isoporae TaxID=570281 RepID=UPI003108BDCE
MYRYWKSSLTALTLFACAHSSSTQAEQWLHYRANEGASAFADLRQINSSNVKNLALAWQFRTGDSEHMAEHMSRTSTQVTPILLPKAAGGHLAFCTPFNRVIALDPKTGHERWSFDPKVNLSGTRPMRCRAVSYWQHPEASEQDKHCGRRLYVATHDRRIVAIDAKQGQRCKSFGDNGEIALYNKALGYQPDYVNNSSAAVVVGNNIVVGSAIIDFAESHAPQGTVVAFDAFTGEQRWSFDPIPKHNDHPMAKDWPRVKGKTPQHFAGGANAWAPLSVDSERDLVFIPTSSPSPDFYGGMRPGDNRYANSVVALKGSTGEVVWHQQIVHHDLWDYDAPAAPVLVDIEKDGKQRAVVIQVTKQGLVFTFDRETGEPVFGQEERPVPQSKMAGEYSSPTQPFPLKPRPLIDVNLDPKNDAFGMLWFDRKACEKRLASLHSEGLFTPLSEQRTLMLPGSLGGANWGGASFWPRRNLLFVNLNTAPFEGQLKPIDPSNPGDHIVAHGSEMKVTMKDSPYMVITDTVTSPLGAPCTKPPWGKMVAIDMGSGDVRWESPLGSIHDMAPFPVPFDINWGTPNLGGSMTTAGGLTFIAATMDKRFRAYDSLSGKVLWTAKLPVDATAVPMSYELDGKQYVILAAGGHKMFNRGTGDYILAYALPD